MPEPVAQIVDLPKRETDAEVAADLKQQLRYALAPVCAILDEASAKGIIIGFQLGKNALGRSVVTDIQANKPL